jgi:hypothetical protein
VLKESARTARSGGSALSSASGTRSPSGSGEASTAASDAGFPELYPLCQVRTVSGNYVTHCEQPAQADGECPDHHSMRGPGWWSRLYAWHGKDLTLLPQHS